MGDNKLDGETRNLESDNVRALAEAFPEVVADGKVDFDKLKLILGEDIDDSDERYSFTWPGKRDAIKMAISRTTGTLRPDKKNSKDWDTTENLFIEGDNLEVLRVLQNSYRGKVKCIYIDPPYNTGKDFVYKDDFKDNLRNYKEQANLGGQSNPETAGRYHTNWLNMMYPRLRLAKNLLTNDGVIFISIDDHEVHNLRKICDEIFGEVNFLADFTWVKREKASGVPPKNMILPNYEHVLSYQNRTEIKFFGQDRSYESYKLDKDGRYWRYMPIQATGEQDNWFDITDPKTGIKYNGNWAFSEKAIADLIKAEKLVFPKNEDGKPVRLVYADEMQNDTAPVFTSLGRHDSEASTKSLIKLLGGKLFDFPKPVSLIKFFVTQVTKDNDIVLDFFAGSATSAHAIMTLNAEDGGSRRFIMVQIPEETPDDSEARKAGYKTIAEISRKRIELAGEKIKADFKDKLAERTTPLDVGFKAFTLDTTNFREWDSNTDNIQNELLAALETFKDGRNSEDALYEVLLKYGVDITEPVEVLNLGGKQVYSLAGNYLLVCLEKDIPLATVEAIAALKPERVVCYDEGFADEDVKQNALETLKRAGVVDVRVV